MERLERIVAGGDGAAASLLACVGRALTHLGRAAAADDATILALQVSGEAATSSL
jgi:hypothetical protein